MPLQSEVWVEFLRCRGCDMRYATTRANFQLLAKVLPSQTTGIASLVLLCDACNLLSAYNKAALPDAATKDMESLGQCVRVAKAFWLEIPCGTERCATPVKALALTAQYMHHASFAPRIVNWKLSDSAQCPSGHTLHLPVNNLSSVTALFGSVENDNA
jgi:hypothetical protein